MKKAYTRRKAGTERWFFIVDWCKKKGISPMVADNFKRAAMEWKKSNCPDKKPDNTTDQTRYNIAKKMVELFVIRADIALKYAGNFPREDVAHELFKLIPVVENRLKDYENFVLSSAKAQDQTS